MFLENRLKLLLIITVAFFFYGCTSIKSSAIVDKSEDQIMINIADNNMTVLVTTVSGIGKGKINLAHSPLHNGYVSFRYADGKAFKTMEMFYVRTDEYQCSIETMANNYIETSCMGTSHRSNTYVGKLESQVIQVDKLLQIRIPSVILQTEPKVMNIEWIDRYRH